MRAFSHEYTRTSAASFGLTCKSNLLMSSTVHLLIDQLTLSVGWFSKFEHLSDGV